jgi:hypothetical protein
VRKRPGVGNFSEQNWGISVSAVKGLLRFCCHFYAHSRGFGLPQGRTSGSPAMVGNSWKWPWARAACESRVWLGRSGSAAINHPEYGLSHPERGSLLVVSPSQSVVTAAWRHSAHLYSRRTADREPGTRLILPLGIVGIIHQCQCQCQCHCQCP